MIKDIIVNMKNKNVFKQIFSTKIDVHVAYINYGDHLGNDSFISILHEARLRFLKSVGCTEKNINGNGIIQKNLVVEYLKQVFYGDCLTVNIGIEKPNKASINFIYNVYNKNNEHVLSASTLIVFFDYKNQKIMRTPSLFFDIYQEKQMDLIAPN